MNISISICNFPEFFQCTPEAFGILFQFYVSIPCFKTIGYYILYKFSHSGLCHYVYPGAMHSRFEHSLGVYHVAGEVMDYLKRYQVSEGNMLSLVAR